MTTDDGKRLVTGKGNEAKEPIMEGGSVRSLLLTRPDFNLSKKLHAYECVLWLSMMMIV